jgi:anti-sigma regulatory factor (Ser/Thr protein kinase)
MATRTPMSMVMGIGGKQALNLIRGSPMSGGTGSVNDCPELQRTGISEDGTRVAAPAGNSGAGTVYHLENSLEFRPLTTAIPCGRLWTRNVLFEWRLTDLTQTAELIVSELMTNAYSMSRPETQFHDLCTITLRLRANHQYLLIEVWDRSPEDPARATAGGDAEHGRGLMIVDALANRWGYYRQAAYRKVVWAELLVPAPAGPSVHNA